MQHEHQKAVTLICNETCPFVNRKNYILRNSPMKKFMLNKVLPVAAHIISLLIGLGIIIIMSHFMFDRWN
jgi:hypothetical protein